jgi:uncharacterized protein (TIGR00255 family)
MALSSMTGFARSHGASGSYTWTWELKSVNAKGLDFRLRLPPGWDAVEIAVRKRASAVLVRGTVYANLTAERKSAAQVVNINEAVLAAIVAAMSSLRGRVEASPPTLDGILGLKGVIDISDKEDSEAERRAVESELVAGFERALASLIEMRQEEGAVLGSVLGDRLTEISTLAVRADAAPGRKPDAIKVRLSAQIATLMNAAERFDSDRLHQEALMLAAKADIREELDRLKAHADQARRLIDGGGPVGRRLDFLAQELGRESNTLTAKANDVELSNIGLELKAIVEQFREQVQNLE